MILTFYCFYVTYR